MYCGIYYIYVQKMQVISAVHKYLQGNPTAVVLERFWETHANKKMSLRMGQINRASERQIRYSQKEQDGQNEEVRQKNRTTLDKQKMKNKVLQMEEKYGD